MNLSNNEKLNKVDLATAGEDIFNRVLNEDRRSLVGEGENNLYEIMVECVKAGDSPEIIDIVLRRAADPMKRFYKEKLVLSDRGEKIYDDILIEYKAFLTKYGEDHLYEVMTNLVGLRCPSEQIEKNLREIADIIKNAHNDRPSRAELAGVAEDIYNKVVIKREDYLFDKGLDILYELMSKLVEGECAPKEIEIILENEAKRQKENFLDKRKIFQKYDDVCIEDHNKKILLREIQKGNDNLCYMFFDADGLKAINDLVGYTKGDEYLGVIMEAIKEAVAEVKDELFAKHGDKVNEIKFYISALGGDEFGVLIVGAKDDLGFNSRIDLTEAVDSKHFNDSMSTKIEKKLGEISTKQVNDLISSKIAKKLNECDLEKRGIIRKDDLIARFKSLRTKEYNKISLMVANEDIVVDEKKWQAILKYIEKHKGSNIETEKQLDLILRSYAALKKLKREPDIKDSQAHFIDEMHDFKNYLILFLHDITEAREKEMESATTGLKFRPSASFGVQHFSEEYIDHIVDKATRDSSGVGENFSDKKEAFLREKKDELLTSLLKNKGVSLMGLKVDNLPEIISRHADWDEINQPGGLSDAELSIIISDVLRDGEANEILDSVIEHYIYETNFRDVLVEKASKEKPPISREKILQMYSSLEGLADDEKKIFNKILSETKLDISLDSVNRKMHWMKKKKRDDLREASVRYEEYSLAKNNFINLVDEYSKIKKEGNDVEIQKMKEKVEKAKMAFRQTRKGYHASLELDILSRNDEMMALEEKVAELTERNAENEKTNRDLLDKLEGDDEEDDMARRRWSR